VRSSSPTTAALGVPPGRGAGDLLTALRAVPDPRPGGARRHPTAFVLGVLVMSFASAGFESFSGTAQWAAAADPALAAGPGRGTGPADRSGRAAERGHPPPGRGRHRPGGVGGGRRGLDRRPAAP